MTLLDSANLFSSFSIHTFNTTAANDSSSAAYSPTPANSRACLACRMAHKSCDRAKPACSRCISRGIAHLCCEPSTKKRGRPRKWKDSEKQDSPQEQYEEEINFNANSSPQPSNNESSLSHSESGVSSPSELSAQLGGNSSPLVYNVIPSSTCKSPVEEALLTETLKKTQSKKLKFIKIMNYNPNHRETFSPRFTITSSEKKHTLSTPQDNQPSQKKRKTKSTNPILSSTNYQTSTVSQPSQPLVEINVKSVQSSPVTSPSSVPTQFSPIPSPTVIYSQTPFTQPTFIPNNSQFYYPTAISTNQPRHCDEGRIVNNNQVKLPSIYSLLSSLQE
ncbi:predicted protein [Naegleria gruberi]|uniref:Predicted protein n=1 Tax=Naegleria gruberi TaxID=5762 RepID=D2VIJ4_NAEGR|nr:uncharacterized protein NAEGRDRAFT_68700 [Naegleria gruberi]EFC43279.1 predicted protein [Naegleria gruberi]|eukprot:XP_002676023.1 predicted protein [Naegleria gruberi strain NEG-M]